MLIANLPRHEGVPGTSQYPLPKHLMLIHKPLQVGIIPDLISQMTKLQEQSHLFKITNPVIGRKQMTSHNSNETKWKKHTLILERV